MSDTVKRGGFELPGDFERRSLLRGNHKLYLNNVNFKCKHVFLQIKMHNYENVYDILEDEYLSVKE